MEITNGNLNENSLKHYEKDIFHAKNSHYILQTTSHHVWQNALVQLFEKAT